MHAGPPPLFIPSPVIHKQQLVQPEAQLQVLGCAGRPLRHRVRPHLANHEVSHLARSHTPPLAVLLGKVRLTTQKQLGRKQGRFD